jgi:hypothetical protein
MVSGTTKRQIPYNVDSDFIITKIDPKLNSTPMFTTQGEQ